LWQLRPQQPTNLAPEHPPNLKPCRPPTTSCYGPRRRPPEVLLAGGRLRRHLPPGDGVAVDLKNTNIGISVYIAHEHGLLHVHAGRSFSSLLTFLGDGAWGRRRHPLGLLAFGGSWGERGPMGAAKGVGSCQRVARKAILWCFLLYFRCICSKKKTQADGHLLNPACACRLQVFVLC
jgi:hypothetical protein